MIVCGGRVRAAQYARRPLPRPTLALRRRLVVAATASLTPAAAMLKRRLGTSPAPRMLTPSEIELLRRSVEEAAEVAGAFFERSEGDSKA